MTSSFHKSLALTALSTCLALLISTSQASAQQVTHPRLQAALYELREAHKELKTARDTYPPGRKEAALDAINDASKSIIALLQIKGDVPQVVGRDKEFYGQYTDHPRLRAALKDLRDARNELTSAKADANGLRERAIDDVDIAIGHIIQLIRK